MDDRILLEKDTEKRIAKLIINRPAVRNALDSETWIQLMEMCRELAKDRSVSTVILTGSGDKAFASGADLNWIKQRTAIEAYESAGQPAIIELQKMPQVTIAAINGVAVGGGCELAMACDLRIAVPKAKFGLPELGLGLIPAAGGTQTMVRLIGLARAKELIFTGRIIDAEEADRIGLINKIVNPEDLMAEATAMAEVISSKAPLALQMAKMSIDLAYDANPAISKILERLSQTVLTSTEDSQEGVSSFLEKRSAKFKGK